MLRLDALPLGRNGEDIRKPPARPGLVFYRLFWGVGLFRLLVQVLIYCFQIPFLMLFLETLRALAKQISLPAAWGISLDAPT